MKRDGRMECGFTQKLKVPSFIAKNRKEKRRRLQEQKVTGKKEKVISLDEIDINRDLMNVRFYLKSGLKEKDIKYFLTISNWTDTSFEIQVNFTQPMVISQGFMRDEMEMTVKNPLLFVSAATGELLDVSSLKFFQTLPT